jgi:hypothetical protein
MALLEVAKGEARILLAIQGGSGLDEVDDECDRNSNSSQISLED